MRTNDDMNRSIHFTIDNDLAEIERLQSEISTIADQLCIPDKIAFQINLSLDEIITNIIHYAYVGTDNPPISIDMTVSDNAVRIEIIDSGKPFDPTDVAPPDIDCPIEERPVGGLGIHLAKSMMDAIEYQRLNNENHLILQKYIPETN